MFSYVVGCLAVSIVLINPIIQLFTPGVPRIVRIPLPRKLDEKYLALESPDLNVSSCPPDVYTVHIFSKEPLVLYLENFLSAEERSHLLEISEPLYTPSTVTHDGGASTVRDTARRDSEVALIPRTPAVQCIEARVRALQGWRDELWVERLRVQRYQPGGHYSHHYDWAASRGGWGRISSIMAWVADDEGELAGGGTEFPRLARRTTDKRWCRFVECISDEPADHDAAGDEAGDGHAGTVFKAVAGNAVFWENFRSDDTGRGYEETWHAGLPVEKGTKVGLNIWSWGRID